MNHPSTRFCPVLVHTQKVLGSASTSILAERRKKGKKKERWREGVMRKRMKEERTDGGREDEKNEGRKDQRKDRWMLPQDDCGDSR